MAPHAQSQIRAHASIIRNALWIAGVRARVWAERDRIDVLVPSGDITEMVYAQSIAEVRRGPFPLLVTGEVH